MHTARPVGLSEDGQSLIVETGAGEEIAILVDPQLRQLLRSVRTRPQLETEMDTAMTPREIQMKIRAGASVEEIADASGMPINRVEAFAAPVIAERNHIAGLAESGSVRRRGESTGHRSLRMAIAERLRERGVDPDSVAWDAFKMDDGRWSISASYRLEQAEREAIFYFDQRGRFSVAGNDDGRWAIGERTQDPAAESTSLQEDTDTEPTLKLSGPADELALLRAMETEDSGTTTDSEAVADSADSTGVEEIEVVEEIIVVEETEPSSDSVEQSQMDLLYDLLGHDGYAEESTHVYDGLTDAAAVPDVADNAWAPEDEQDYPAEPEAESGPEIESGPEAELETENADEPAAVLELKASARTETNGAAQDTLPGADVSEPDVPPTAEPESVRESEPAEGAEPAATTNAAEPEAEAPKPAAKSKKRKRASVPSWDEIMFGSPKAK